MASVSVMDPKQEMEQNEGVLGLGMGENTQNSTTSAIEAILTQAGLRRRFSFFSGRKDQPSMLTLGGYHDGFVRQNVDDLKEVAILPEASRHGSWRFALPAISFAGKQATTRTAVLDSGTSMILLPRKDESFVRYIQKLVLANGLLYACRPQGYVVVCGILPSLPALRITVKGTDNKYQMRLLGASDFFINMTDSGGNFYLLGIDTADVDDIILGDVFLKRHYAMFDADARSVRFYDLGASSIRGDHMRLYLHYLLMACAAGMTLVAIALVRVARYYSRRRMSYDSYVSALPRRASSTPSTWSAVAGSSGSMDSRSSYLEAQQAHHNAAFAAGNRANDDDDNGHHDTNNAIAEAMPSPPPAGDRLDRVLEEVLEAIPVEASSIMHLDSVYDTTPLVANGGNEPAERSNPDHAA